MIQRIVKTDLNSLIASSKIPSNRLFVKETRIISQVGMGNLREKYKTDEWETF